MTARRFYWIDAFTDRPLGGNPCAVVFGADDLPVEDRIAFTRETRLSECAFVVASDKADFGARYYLASGEIKMAGHPTIATCAALEEAGLLAGRAAFTLEVGAGVVGIEVDRSAARPVFTMTQYAPVFGRSYAPERIAPIVALDPSDIVGTPQTVSTGGPHFCVTLLKDRAALERAELSVAILRALRPEIDFWEPFLCTREGFTAAGDTAARLMLTPPEPPEDPFTGSATGSMAAYLWHHGLIGAPVFTAEQGHAMGRPGSARVEVLGPRDAISGVKVGGSASVLMEGTVRL